MSRRTFSFSNAGSSFSPLKDHPKISQPKHLKNSETRQITNRESFKSPSLASNLRIKLKEKYTNLAFAIKKISEQHPVEYSLPQFKLLLKDLKIKYCESDLKEFIKTYATNEKGSITVSIQSLSKCLHSGLPIHVSTPSGKKLSLIRNHNFSTSSSTKALEETFSSLNLTIPSQKSEESPLQPSGPGLYEDLIQIFKTPELATDYFFIDRDQVISFEEFSSSLSNLGLPENQSFFSSLTRRDFLSKQEFFNYLYHNSCLIQDETSKLISIFRSKLQTFFSNHVKAFQEISSASGHITLPILQEVSEKIGLSLEKSQLNEMFSRYDSNCKLKFKQFKSFWLGKEGICAVKSCEENILENFSYCKNHFYILSNRGEEIFTKLQIIMKQGNLLTLAQEILDNPKTKGFMVNGFELQRKDVQALRESLKVHGFSKKRSANSVKSRV